MIDLFDRIDLAPPEIQQIVDRYSDINDGDLQYQECEDMLKEVEAHGYTFEYGLDAIPYGLKKISDK